MSRSRPGLAERITNRNESKEGNFDPARNFPTKASLDAGWAEYNGRWEAWEAAGKVGEEPHPPAGMLSAIADRLIPRRAPHHGKRWR
jgi:hypothetical protein